MTDPLDGHGQASKQGGEPAINLPRSVAILAGVLLVIHAAATFALDDAGRQQLAIWFAFIPVRLIAPDEIPGGLWPMIWTPLTHAFLHGDWVHVGFNTLWLAIFGTPVAKRYGGAGFVIVFCVGAVAGALAFALTSYAQVAVVIGASGGVSALTGAAVRFIFSPIEVVRHPDTGEVVAVLGRRTLSLMQLLRDRRAGGFTLIWVGLNAMAPILPALLGLGEVGIAWQAHLGGFIAGLLMVSLLDAWVRRAAR